MIADHRTECLVGPAVFVRPKRPKRPMSGLQNTVQEARPTSTGVPFTSGLMFGVLDYVAKV
jgi:galactose-1-phosphate uridylyltransferase